MTKKSVYCPTLEQTQHRAVRYVTSDYNPFNSVSLHISNLKWDTLEDCRNKSRLCMFYKMAHNQATIPYQLYIQPSIIHTHVIQIR